MTARNILVGLGAGLVAALLYLGQLTGASLAFLLTLVSSLPIAIAGVGFGTVSGAVAAAVAVLMIGALTVDRAGLVPMLVYLISLAAPTAWVAHLVGLARPVEGAPEQREWFPLDMVLLRATLASAVSVVAMLAIAGPDSAKMTKTLVEQMSAVFAESGADAPTPDQLELFARMLVGTVPAIMGAWSLLYLVLNVWLGARIVHRSGLLARPWSPLWTVRMPRAVVAFFGLAFLLSFVPGTIGDIATAFAGCFAMALALMGFAYVHFVLQNRPAKNGLLWLLYIVSIPLTGLAIIVMGLLGLADTLFDLRLRYAQRRTGSP